MSISNNFMQHSRPLVLLAVFNSSKLVAALYLGPMKSLWHISKDYCGPFPLPFTATSDLAAWTRFGTSIIFEARLLLLHVLVLTVPNSFKLVAALYLGPMKILWHILKDYGGPFPTNRSPIWPPGLDFCWEFMINYASLEQGCHVSSNTTKKILLDLNFCQFTVYSYYLYQ